MNVGVEMLVVMHDGVNDGARLLRGGRAVEINQPFAMDALGEDGKIGTDLLDIERLRFLARQRLVGHGLGEGAHPTSSQFRFSSSSITEGAVVCTALTNSCSRSRMSFSANSRAAASFMRSRHSAAKA